MTKLFGYTFTKEQGYIISLVAMTIFLVILAQFSGSLAVGLALTILFAVAIVATNSQGTVLP